MEWEELQLQAFLNSVIGGVERSASSRGRFIPGDGTHDTLCTEGCLGPRADQKAAAKKKILAPAVIWILVIYYLFHNTMSRSGILWECERMYCYLFQIFSWKFVWNHATRSHSTSVTLNLLIPLVITSWWSCTFPMLLNISTRWNIIAGYITRNPEDGKFLLTLAVA
jgi:hypothetical protein